MDILTSKEFWISYWENKKNLVVDASKNYFSPIFDKVLQDKKNSKVIELGGFPGLFAIPLIKKYQCSVDLFDYVAHQEIFQKIMQANHVALSSIQLIEGDLFLFPFEPKYDLAYSVGLIEHFSDSTEIFSLHKKCLIEGGNLIITLPNFKSLNGWFQKKFDLQNYQAHNISCMDIAHLKQSAIEAGFTNVEVFYFGKFSIWLENYDKQPWFVKIFFQCVWLKGKILTKIFPFESKALSPYLVVTATK